MRIVLASKPYESCDAISPALREMANKKLAASDWLGYLYVFNRAWRLPQFVQIMNRMSDSDYWATLREIWIDSEASSANRGVWLRLFASARKCREHLMESADHAAFAGLPDPVRIYRGGVLPRGISWTTDTQCARFFAERFDFNGGGEIFVTEVPRRKLLAYFVGCGEAEAVIDSRRIQFDTLALEYWPSKLEHNPHAWAKE